MNLKTTLLAATAVIALGAAALMTSEQAGAADMSRGEVEKIVHEYLIANPEILRDMKTELDKKDAVAAESKAKEGIASEQNALTNDGYSYVAGNPKGDVTVVEFFDYRCGYCKLVSPDVQKLLEADGNVRLVLKEFPILSKVSTEAARAAMASINQGDGLYWKFHNAMFAADSLDSAAIYDVAGDVGLDVARLKKDMSDPKIDERIAQNHKLAATIGVDGTPAFIIGNQFIPGAVSSSDLKTAVDAQRGSGG